MTVLYVGLENGLQRIALNGSGDAERVIAYGPVMDVQVDPADPNHVYAAVSGRGVFWSSDGGRSFEQSNNQFRSQRVWSLGVSATERGSDGGVVYAGTLPSAAYRSEDGGRNWRELTAFQDVPGQENWSFPPQPTTHLIHKIAVPVTEPSTVLAGIELGGIVKSTDGGQTWAQVEGAGWDCHELRTHPAAPGHYYESDGAGYVESFDHGQTWTVACEGIPDELRYFYAMAVDPGDPENVLISCSRDQYTGHALRPNTLAWDRTVEIDFEVFSTIYRRRATGEPWHEVSSGLPDSNGSPLGRFATSPAESGVFYYWTVAGDLYRSEDGGEKWERVEIRWPDAEKRIVHSASASEEA